jgi:Leucine-rich repeat (LRR) protein
MEKKTITREYQNNLNNNAFDSMGYLKQLYLNENQLAVVKKSWFKNLKKLEILGLNNDEILEIENNAFGSLVNLKQLYIGYNKLTLV